MNRNRFVQTVVTIVMLAGRLSVPDEYYEAAEVDGANAWQKFRYITLPMLTPATFFVSIMLTIASFKVFDLILIMTYTVVVFSIVIQGLSIGRLLRGISKDV